MIELNLISSYSVDIVDYKTTGKVLIKKGGPMYFFEKQFLKFKDEIKANILKAGFCLVDIERFEDEEIGNIAYAKKNIKTAFFSRASKIENLVISFIKDEIELDHLNSYEVENLFVDLQGYYRVFKNNKIDKDVFPRFRNLFLKATQKELDVLSSSFKREILKNHILLVTKGKQGVELINKGNRKNFLPNRIVDSRDTIGAGDTFFITFIISYLFNQNLELAVRQGMEKVEEFLAKPRNKDIIF